MNINNYITHTNDGFDLDTVSFTPDTSNGHIIVMCHGLTGVRQGRTADDTYLVDLAQKLCSMGYKVVQFGWRGHGNSSGNDTDVCCKSFYTDLDTIIRNEQQGLSLSLWGWSIGGFAILQYLLNTNIQVDRVCLWSPVVDPISSFFYNKNSVACYRSIVDSTKDGSLYTNGYALWSAKNFKISLDFLNQSRSFDYLKAFNLLPKNTYILLGDNDVIVDKSIAQNYAEEFGIKYDIISGGHALFENIDKVINLTVDYFKI